MFIAWISIVSSPFLYVLENVRKFSVMHDSRLYLTTSRSSDGKNGHFPIIPLWHLQWNRVMWVKQCINHPPVITIFIGDMFSIPSHGWYVVLPTLFYYCLPRVWWCIPMMSRSCPSWITAGLKEPEGEFQHERAPKNQSVHYADKSIAFFLKKYNPPT